MTMNLVSELARVTHARQNTIHTGNLRLDKSVIPDGFEIEVGELAHHVQRLRALKRERRMFGCNVLQRDVKLARIAFNPIEVALGAAHHHVFMLAETPYGAV